MALLTTYIINHIKRLFFFFFLFIFGYSTFAQTGNRNLTIKKTGTLDSILPTARQAEVKQLHLKGSINEKDLLIIKMMSQKYQNLRILDLDEVDNMELLPDSVFVSCSSLREVVLPRNLKRIGNAAFQYCTNLKKVTFSNKISTIGDDAFYGCENLKFIDLPNAITSIGKGAFSHCSRIATITLPASISNIAAEAFYACSSLQVIRCMAITPPSCGENTFNGISVDDCVLYVPEKAEESYKEANSWSIFNHCFPLQPNKDTPIVKQSIHEDDTLIITSKKAGSLQQQLSISWLLAKSIKVRGPINDNDIAFLSDLAQYNGEGKLEKLDISAVSGINILPDSSFMGCRNLNCILLPTGITEIGDAAFYACSDLSIIKMPLSLKKIGNETFRDCKSLKSIYIPNSVNKIGTRAFQGCSGLTSISLPGFLTTIEDNTFQGCTKLNTIDLPEHLHSISHGAFLNCSNLKSVIIPDGVSNIGESAFESCNSLTSITLPNDVKSIKKKTFWGCTSLTEIGLPENISNIDDWAFRDCQKLMTLNIPRNTISIGEKSFSGCRGLTIINCEATKPPTCANDAFDASTQESCELDLPIGSSTTYILNEGWWKFVNVKEK